MQYWDLNSGSQVLYCLSHTSSPEVYKEQFPPQNIKEVGERVKNRWIKTHYIILCLNVFTLGRIYCIFTFLTLMEAKSSIMFLFYVCMYVFTFLVYVCVYACICMYVFIFQCMCVCIHACMYMCVCMYYVCVCI
jgi:hypothetical protein